MRGDRPFPVQEMADRGLATPHARGSTLAQATVPLSDEGYPACAGIDLMATQQVLVEDRLPRMRGDRPQTYRLV